MKHIEIGDLHVKKDNIDESKRFIHWLVDVIKKTKATSDVKVVFLGDQFNDFGVARVEVIQFWSWASHLIKSIAGKNSVYYLVGNHDRNSEGTDTAMHAFHENGIIIDKEAMLLSPDIGAVGFIRDNETFVKEVMRLYEHGVTLMYCHQEFQGAMFESGAYAPHGVDPTTLPSNLKFRVGHFHKKQSFGNIKYLGTPRHLTKSDIGEQKGIHIYDTDSDKDIFIPTPEEVCESLKFVTIKEGDKLPDINFTNKVYVELSGSKSWCEKFEKKIPQGTKINCSYTDIVKEIKVKESDGIPASFSKYFDTQDLPSEIKLEVLRRVYEACPQLRGSSE